MNCTYYEKAENEILVKQYRHKSHATTKHTGKQPHHEKFI